MAYKSYSEQIHEHLMFLQSNGFDIDELKVNANFVRCRQIDKRQYRGELVYKTRTSKLNNGLTGIQTWLRGPQGQSSSFQTYGLSLSRDEKIEPIGTLMREKSAVNTALHEIAGRKAYGFWQSSAVSGRSEYLQRKKTGYYGIRFRSSLQYGDVAVIPMVDFFGRLWSYQLLNPDGTKRQPKDTRTEGLYHMIGTPVHGQPIGVGESYVTAASCFELTDIPTACAFSCQNLKNIATTLKQHYPKSKLIVFADNDRHLETRRTENQGLLKALEAIKSFDDGVLVAPDFGNIEAVKNQTDWNDLIHAKGFEYTKIQIKEKLKENNLFIN